MSGEKKKAPEKAVPKQAVKRSGKKPGRLQSIGKWFREMKGELKKVIWPTPKQTANNTMVALVVMFAAAIVIWGFDTLADEAVKALITLTS